MLSFEESKIIFYEYKKEFEASWTLFDDVKTCLEKLKETEKGIAGNREMSQQQNKIHVTGIDKYFVVKKYAGEMRIAKPEYGFFEELKKIQ